MSAQRLDKLLAHAGLGSRRETAAMARGGRVAVNGAICRVPDCKIDPEKDKLTVDGREIPYRAHWYLMLNKPAGLITATEDPRHETVFSLLPSSLRSVGLFPVGRLDKDTEGLLLLTTDGDFSHALMSPGRHVSKVYEACVEGVPAPDAQARFMEGLTLKDGTVCRPAALALLEPGRVRVTLHEGKYHQVKRMLKAVGCEVTALRRTQIGGLPLDETLAPGAFRELSTEERQTLLTPAPADS